ncbi:MAG: hypothetical protein O7H41_20095 [Planctomycetota bacterium]|nr:hypothetical protein [Planctomycetota bacterium]
MWKWIIPVVVTVGVGAGIVWGMVGKTTGDYIDHTVQAAEFVRRRTVVLSAQNKIKSHLMKNGSYPATIDEVEGLPTLPEGWVYSYDPYDGKVEVFRDEDSE